MKGLKTRNALACLTAAVACLLLGGCEKQARVEPSGTPTPTPAVAGTPPAAQPTAPPAPPAAAEAEAALERVYKRALVIDKAHREPPVVGDFNGDGSEDIAVAARPAEGMLAELNSEFANWVLGDPVSAAAPEPKKGARPTPEPAQGRVQVAQGDRLLAIIHGHGREGWRDPAATQSYLLRNAVGEGMQRAPLRGYPPALKVLGQGAHRGADIISGRLARAPGFLYWARGKYTWQEE
jgi:hypothetical protein